MLRLPGGLTEDECVARARRESVAVEHLGRHWISAADDHPQGIVVGFAAPAEHAFGPAVAALVRALDR